MPIPKKRSELTDLVTTAASKLLRELDEAGPEIGRLRCVDDWTVKDLLVVRAWWTESVLSWIEAGKRGESFSLPAHGYRWTETPRLNSDLVAAARRESYSDVRRRLEEGSQKVLATIEALDDRQLLETGVFAWAGKWPLSRWISINTARQYTTARTYVRRAIRSQRLESAKKPPAKP